MQLVSSGFFIELVLVPSRLLGLIHCHVSPLEIFFPTDLVLDEQNPPILDVQ